MNMKAIVLTVLIATVMMSPVHGLTKIAKNAKTAKNAINAMDAMDATGAKTAINAINAMNAMDAVNGLTLRGKSGNKDTGFLQSLVDAKVSQPYPRACPCRRTSSGVAGPRLCVSPSAL